MKRGLLKLGVVLPLGAIINVVIAWTSALAVVPREVASDLHQGWAFAIYESFSAGRVLALNNPYNPGDSNPRSFPRWANWSDMAKNTDVGSQMVDARGWPMLALRSENADLSWLSGIALPPQTPGSTLVFEQRALPIDPIWPGFAINTIFYAAILWLLWITPGRVRRFIRIRRHRCPACGFIIAKDTCANGLCSECGAGLPWMKRAGS